MNSNKQHSNCDKCKSRTIIGHIHEKVEKCADNIDNMNTCTSEFCKLIHAHLVYDKKSLYCCYCEINHKHSINIECYCHPCYCNS